jgi:hypothetical protein
MNFLQITCAPDVHQFSMRIVPMAAPEVVKEQHLFGREELEQHPYTCEIPAYRDGESGAMHRGFSIRVVHDFTDHHGTPMSPAYTDAADVFFNGKWEAAFGLDAMGSCCMTDVDDAQSLSIRGGVGSFVFTDCGHYDGEIGIPNDGPVSCKDTIRAQ